jgi:hypothetical protein
VPVRPPLAPLTADETRVRESVRANYDASVALLERAVNIPSGTHNVAGVRQVGDLFGAELRALGFAVRWAELPAAMRRAGHLVATHTRPRVRRAARASSSSATSTPCSRARASASSARTPWPAAPARAT